jgi:nucleoside-diphosphate-sugar epimerase
MVFESLKKRNIMNRPQATIIGGNGFIGSHLSTRLIATGWDCHVPHRNMPIADLDLTGHVFYCAGLTADYIHRPFDTVEAHVSLLSRILEKDSFESLVYLSSTRLYDSLTDDVATEDSPLTLNPRNPRHIYDLSKALGESLCSLTGKGKARVARLSCVYNDHTDYEGFLPGLLQQIIQNRPNILEVDSSPSFARDYIHLQDVLDALIFIARHGSECIYNVASGENITNEALFSALSQASGCRVIALNQEISSSPPRISINKMQEACNWQPMSVLQKIAAIIEENS